MESIHLTSVTREEAEEWLGRTNFQRPIGERRVRFMTRDMNTGEWVSTVAPPIYLDENTGAVLDGQHRLRAFLASELETFDAYVARVPRRHIEVIDTGKSRSLTDTLKIRGHEYAEYKSAWINRAMDWALGLKPSHVLTRRDQVELIESAPNLEAVCKEARQYRVSSSNKVLHIPIGVTTSLIDMEHYGWDHGLAGEFVGNIQTSQGLDAMLSRLQAKLLDAANPRTRLTMPPDTQSYLIARVFGAWMNNTDLDKMYARHKAVEELPGYVEWVEANFGSLL